MTADRAAPSIGVAEICATCRWWGVAIKRTKNDQMLPCLQISKVIRSGMPLWTPPEFGCNQWEARNDE